MVVGRTVLGLRLWALLSPRSIVQLVPRVLLHAAAHCHHVSQRAKILRKVRRPRFVPPNILTCRVRRVDDANAGGAAGALDEESARTRVGGFVGRFVGRESAICKEQTARLDYAQC